MAEPERQPTMTTDNLTVDAVATAIDLNPSDLKDYGFVDTTEGLQTHGVLITADHDTTRPPPGWGYQTITGRGMKPRTPKGQQGHLVFVRQTRLRQPAPSRPNPRILVVAEGAIEAVTAAAEIYRTFNVVGAQNAACMASKSFSLWLAVNLPPFYKLAFYAGSQYTTSIPEKVVVLARNTTQGINAAKSLAANVAAIDPAVTTIKTVKIVTPDKPHAGVADYHKSGGEKGPMRLTEVNPALNGQNPNANPE